MITWICDCCGHEIITDNSAHNLICGCGEEMAGWETSPTIISALTPPDDGGDA